MKLQLQFAAVVAATAILVGPAFADKENNGCQGNCPSGDLINNTTNNTGIGVGVGVGGQGGAGGDANVGNGLGNFSPSARVDNDVRNTNTLSQQQQQNQAQQSTNVNANVNKNEANAGAVSGSVSGAAAQNNGNKQAVQINTYNPGTIQYSGSYTVRNVPNFAIGGPASGACNGFSATLGGAVAGFGAGGGVSLLDKTCVCDRLAGRFAHLAQIALQAGDTGSYARLMAKSERMAAAGEECLTTLANEEQPAPAPQKTAQSAPAQQVVAVANPTNCVNDEFIARRTGAALCKR